MKHAKKPSVIRVTYGKISNNSHAISTHTHGGRTMKTKIIPAVIALVPIATCALGDEVDDHFQKARK